MNYYYITGTSRGIGKAFAELLLKDGNNFVTGISRTCTINHPNYSHVALDLSDTKQVSEFKFIYHKDAEKIVLVNNAGYVGELKRMGRHKHKTLTETYTVNLIAPTILINNFIKAYSCSAAGKIIFNVSSIAGRYPIDATGAYCASKSALDMLSKSIAKEQAITGLGFRIASISVGAVDTEMQKLLRDADENEFSHKAEAVSYKESGEMPQPEQVAGEFVSIINNIGKINEVVFSFDEYEEMNVK